MLMIKKKNPLINKVLLIVLSLVILVLIGITILSLVYLAPVDKKSDAIIEFKVNEGMSKNSIADSLEAKGLIKNALVFKIYIRLNLDKEFYAGTYNLSKNMSVNEIIGVLNSNQSIENETITVTFIEGKRLVDYVKKISTTFNFKEEDVLKLLNDEDYINRLIEQYWFITEDIKNEKIYYPLEGYLFADTYNFKKDSTIEEVVNKMINTTGQKLDVFKDEIAVSKYKIHDLMTLSSIIELEGAGTNDRKGVGGVFYNRLNRNEPLGSDVTTYYGVKKNFDRDLSVSNLKSCNGYNTRAESTCPIIGLPVGPISSPSLASITAAIEPEENDYLFFVADKTGKTYFSKTYGEHTSTVKKLKKDGLWYEY